MPQCFYLNQYRARAGEKLRKVRPSERASVGGEQREKERSEWSIHPGQHLFNFYPKVS